MPSTSIAGHVANIARTILPAPAKTMLGRLRRNYQTLHTLARYRGDKVLCSLCDRRFDRFAPTGVLERPFWKSPEGQRLLELDFVAVANRMCPNCGSGERHRLMYFYLRDRLAIQQKPGLALLDVAPDGFIQRSLFARLDLDYVSIDITDERSPTHVMDLTDMSFPDQRFDAVICYHVLEHIRDDRRAMREIRRVLKPDGFALLQVPIWAETTVEDPTAPKEKYEELYGHRGHVRRYGMDYPDRLREEGFQVTIDGFAREMPGTERERYGIDPAELLFLCHVA